MAHFKHSLLLRFVKILDVILVTVPFAMCWYMYYAKRICSPFYSKGNLLMVALFVCLYVVFGRIYDAFSVSMQRISELIYGQFLASAMSDVVMYMVIWLLSKKLPNILPGLAAFAGQFVIVAAWSFLSHKWYFSTFPPRDTAVIYDTRQGLDSLIGKYGLDKKYNVVMTASAKSCIEDLSILDGIDTVFMSGIHSHDRNIILKYCIANDINSFVIPRVGDTIMAGAHRMHMFHLLMLRVGRSGASPEYFLIKRITDILVSLVALILLSPIFIVTSIAIKLTDRGPIFYKQVRLTKDGRAFNILKFRSMRVDAEKDGIARLSTGKNDSRVTPIGKIIRACRIDELPQIFNILGGSMTLVGPRAERPEIHNKYCDEMPEFALRLQAKAGLTGYAQIYGKYNTTPYDKLIMDLMYIAHPSIFEDLKIMLATIKVLFIPESTEGVAEGAVTAEESGTVAPEETLEKEVALKR